MVRDSCRMTVEVTEAVLQCFNGDFTLMMMIAFVRPTLGLWMAVNNATSASPVSVIQQPQCDGPDPKSKA